MLKHQRRSRPYFATIVALTLFIGALQATAQTDANTSAPPIKPSVTVTTLINFDYSDGENPFEENLVQGKDGNLYGTTLYGGSTGFGTVFKVSTSGVLTTLYTFTGGDDGANPYAGLTLGVDGNFYGTTFDRGTSTYGTVFKITPSGTLTTLHDFVGTDGGNPSGALVQGADRNFYGTTNFGADGTYGTIFKITPTGSFTTLVNFNGSNGMDPAAGVLRANGMFYGTTTSGGNSTGTVFAMTSAGVLTTLFSFADTNGTEPVAQLIQGSNGNFYGTTLRGGANENGEVFEITPSGSLTVLHSFDGTDGSMPYASVTQATDGNLYGTTSLGGGGNQGTIFELTPGGTFTSLYSFSTTSGEQPYGGLVQHTSGALFGVTPAGGTVGAGTVFEVDAGLAPFVRLVPTSGTPGSKVMILGTNLTGVTSVTFDGIPAAWTPGSSTYLTAVVPSTAMTGLVKVTTSCCMLTSNVPFRVF
ncbi:MAG TPA: choice-of-anchor tandem repeat GloVer-containing protein [Candidatus Sulfotelmatobacter sp.]